MTALLVDSLIVVDSLLALDIVPPVTGEFFLIENSTICTQERCSLISFTAIVTDVIGLAAGLHIGIHTRHGGDMGTRERGVWHFMINRIVDTWHTGYFI